MGIIMIMRRTTTMIYQHRGGGLVYVRRRHLRCRHQQHVNQSLFWAGGYCYNAEDQDVLNNTLKRRSVMATHSSAPHNDTIYDSAVRRTTAYSNNTSSSRGHHAPPTSATATDHQREGVELTDTSTVSASHHDGGDHNMVPEPKHYMGPPRHQDGHELHNVKFVLDNLVA